MSNARQELEGAIAQLLEEVTESATTVQEQRAGYNRFGDRMPVAATTSVTETTYNGVPCHDVLAEGADANDVILYLHGGGYVIGSFRSHQGFLDSLSRLTKARAVLVDYRLAPEHQAPSAIEDAVEAYRGLLDSGVAPGRIVISGDSAGGGLGLATLVAIRDRGLPQPAAGVLLSPWTDLNFTGGSLATNKGIDTMVDEDWIKTLAVQYIGGGSSTDPLISPVYADHAGLPPLMIFCGTDEILLDDSKRVAESAAAAGVPVVFKTWDGMLHVFPTYAPLLPEGHPAWVANHELAAFMRDHFASAPTPA